MPLINDTKQALDHLRDTLRKRDRWVLLTDYEYGHEAIKRVYSELVSLNSRCEEDSRYGFAHVFLRWNGSMETLSFCTIPRQLVGHRLITYYYEALAERSGRRLGKRERRLIKRDEHRLRQGLPPEGDQGAPTSRDGAVKPLFIYARMEPDQIAAIIADIIEDKYQEGPDPDLN